MDALSPIDHLNSIPWGPRLRIASRSLGKGSQMADLLRARSMEFKFQYLVEWSREPAANIAGTSIDRARETHGDRAGFPSC